MKLRAIAPGSTVFKGFIAQLSAAGLPTDDLHDEGGKYYALGETEQETLAFGGLVPLGDDALLRSVVVPNETRGTGRGALIIDALADMAGTHGIRRLWLLTTDADGYFRRLGFTDVPRDKASPEVAATRQFSDLCPSSAVVMCRTLA